MLLPLLLIPLLSTVFAKQYTLNHRYSNSGADFTRYGTIDIPENDMDSNGVIRIEQTTAESARGGDGWFQVQLTGEGLGAGVLSSTNACYLNSGPVTLVIHKSHPKGISSIDLIPHASTPRDGSCPTTRSTSDSDVTIMREVVVKSPHLVYGPDLSPPPPPTPVGVDGKPVPPPEEKSFLQKYWLPLLGVGFFVISQMAPEDNTKGKPAAAAN